MASEGPAKTESASASPAAAAPTGTVTFLFTDIEGSTRLLERLRGRYAEVLADQRRLLREAFAAWHGHEIDTQGDSFFVAFPRASEALRCAIAAQHSLAAWHWPPGVEVRVRMGIHTGEPLVASGGYVGMDVHRAARIAAAGHGGQVLLSGTARDLVADDLPESIELRDLGNHRLKDMRTETRLYQVGGEGLRADFEPLVTSAADEPAPTPGEPPYRGLQAFEEEDAALFFGREEIVGELLEQLRGARLLAIIGASGSGKSSILRAGAIPALREEQARWRVLLLTPTAHPIEALAGAIEPDASPARLAALADDLRADPRSLAVALRPTTGRASAGRGRTVIAIDQLEEVFTLCRDEIERKAFLAALVHASGLDDGPADTPPDADRATVLVTLRADFYASLAPYPTLRDAAAASQRYVGAMSPEELRRAIEEPARRGGWDFTPGLVDLLLRDVGDEPGALPLLSHALLETWRRRRGTMLTLRSYAESGGVKGAIARTADRVYESELTDAQQRIARDIFVRLTELGEGAQDTRRRAMLPELMPNDDARAAAVRDVVGALADARLVTVGEDTIEVAHEALIREWPTLREWLRADREGLRLHRRLTEAAREWQLSDLDESLLFRGARLAQARETIAFKGVLNELEGRFLDASVALAEQEETGREAARQREIDAAQAVAAAESRRAEEAARSASGLRRRAVMLAAALVVAAVLAGVAFILARESDANATLAQQRAEEAGSNASIAEERAREARENADLAAQSAQEARDAEALAEEQATRAFAERLGADATQILASGREPELAALLSLNALRAGYTPQADAALQRASRAGFGQVFMHDGPVDSLGVTPDDKTMITVADGTVHVWDVDSGSTTQTFPAPLRSGLYSYLELSADGRVLLVSGYDGPGALYRVSGAGPALVEPIRVDCPSLDASDGIRALSGDGKVLATYLTGGAAGGGSGDVVAVTIPDCDPVGEPFRLAGVNDPTLSYDGTRFAASILDNGVMTVWDVINGREISTFGVDLGQFWHSSFSRDGTKVVNGSFDGIARVFDAESGDLLETYRGHAGAVEHAILSDDGSRLLTSSVDHTARLWDTDDKTELRRYFHGDEVAQATLSADGTHVFTASRDGTARSWSVRETEEFLFKASDAEVDGLAFAPGGDLLAGVGGEDIRIYDLAAQRLVLEEKSRSPKLVAFSPVDESLLVASSYGTSLLDRRTGDEIRALSASEFAGFSGAASFSGDGSLALGSNPVEPNTLLIWASSTGSLRLSVPLETGVLSLDGSRVAGWAPRRLSVYDTRMSDAIMPPVALGEGPPVDVAFTPDATRLVTGEGDNVVRLRDVATGDVLLEMPGHTSPIRQVRVSADGAYALSASDDGSARLWDLATGDLVRFFVGHDGRSVTSIAISPDGGTVALGSSDGTVIVASVSATDLEAEVCAGLSRDLTDQERAAYGIVDQTPTCP